MFNEIVALMRLVYFIEYAFIWIDVDILRAFNMLFNLNYAASSLVLSNFRIWCWGMEAPLVLKF